MKNRKKKSKKKNDDKTEMMKHIWKQKQEEEYEKQ